MIKKFSVWQGVILPVLRWLGILRLFAFINRNKLIILFYHGVTREAESKGIRKYNNKHVSIGAFQEQMKYLSQRYNVIDLYAAVEAIKSKRSYSPYSVAITFDDGYRNNYTVALPVLTQYGLNATIFLTAGFIGTNKLPWWETVENAIDNTGLEELKIDVDGQTTTLTLGSDENKIKALRQLKGVCKAVDELKRREVVSQVINKLKGTDVASGNGLFLTWEEVRELRRQGMNVGAHTVNHVQLARETKERMTEEILNSKKKIEEQLEEKVELFAYPDGGPSVFNDETRQALIDAQFRCALVTISGMNELNSDLYELKRIWISGSDNFFSFLAKLSGFGLFEQSLRTKVRHRVGR